MNNVKLEKYTDVVNTSVFSIEEKKCHKNLIKGIKNPEIMVP